MDQVPDMARCESAVWWRPERAISACEPPAARRTRQQSKERQHKQTTGKQNGDKTWTDDALSCERVNVAGQRLFSDSLRRVIWSSSAEGIGNSGAPAMATCVGSISAAGP